MVKHTLLERCKKNTDYIIQKAKIALCRLQSSKVFFVPCDRILRGPIVNNKSFFGIVLKVVSDSL